MSSIINNKDITIVMHGAVVSPPDMFEKYRYSDIALESLRRVFPGSYIILSTWKDQVVPAHYQKNLIDYLISSPDPGPSFISRDQKFSHNMDRHIQSSRRGLNKVKTKYTLLIRTDLLIESRKIVEKFQKYSTLIEKPEWAGMNEPILALAGGTKYEKSIVKQYPFHTCDFLYFGRTEDLLSLFDLEICSDGRFCSNESKKPIKKHVMFYFSERASERDEFLKKSMENPYYMQRYIAETFPIISYLKRIGVIENSHSWYSDHESIKNSFAWHTKSTILVSAYLSGVRWLKSPYCYQKFPGGAFFRYTEYLWLYSVKKNIFEKASLLFMHYLWAFLRGFLCFLTIFIRKKILR